MNLKNETPKPGTVLAPWIVKKIAKATEEHQKTLGIQSIQGALGDLELQAATLLRADLISQPSLSGFVPADFLHLLNSGGISAMSTLERAALIIIEVDSRTVCPKIQSENDLLEFSKIKWFALGSLLMEYCDEK